MGFMDNLANAGVQEYLKRQIMLSEEQLKQQQETVKLLQELTKLLKDK